MLLDILLSFSFGAFLAFNGHTIKTLEFYVFLFLFIAHGVATHLY